MDADSVSSKRKQHSATRQFVVRLFIQIFVCFLIAPYLVLPHYDFAPALPFHGSRWHNPYADLSLSWVKANFHTHAKAWSGATDGVNSRAHIDSVYRSMKYDVVSLSNYFSIDSLTSYSANADFVPCYEHGYSIQKSHRLVIGANAVSWFDVITPQTTHIKQFFIHQLSASCDLLALAHPAFGRPSYTIADAQQLCDYPCMEVLNHYRNSLTYWDAALSAGRRVYIVANDDSHNADERGETGVRWTMIHVNHNTRAEIANALRLGKSVGVSGHGAVGDLLPTAVEVVHDTLDIRCSNTFRHCRLIGQNGVVKQLDSNASQVRYALRSGDSYIRAEIETDSCTVYLNPITREDVEQTPTHATINIPLSMVKVMIFMLLSTLLVYLLFFRAMRVAEVKPKPL